MRLSFVFAFLCAFCVLLFFCVLLVFFWRFRFFGVFLFVFSCKWVQLRFVAFWFFFWRLRSLKYAISFSEICVFVLQQKRKRCKLSSGEYCTSYRLHLRTQVIYNIHVCSWYFIFNIQMLIVTARIYQHKNLAFEKFERANIKNSARTAHFSNNWAREFWKQHENLAFSGQKITRQKITPVYTYIYSAPRC